MPGLRSRLPVGVPFGHLMEATRAAFAPTRRRPRPVAPARALEWFGYRIVLPEPRGPAAAHLVASGSGSGSASCPAGSASRDCRSPRSAYCRLDADPGPRRILFTGCVMDAWQRPVHRAALAGDAGDGHARRAVARTGAPRAAARSTLHAGRLDEARASPVA